MERSGSAGAAINAWSCSARSPPARSGRDPSVPSRSNNTRGSAVRQTRDPPASSIRRLPSSPKAPPPHWRNANSPSCAKIREIGLPPIRSTLASVSTNSRPSCSPSQRPTADLPDPGGPASTMFNGPVRSRSSAAGLVPEGLGLIAHLEIVEAVTGQLLKPSPHLRQRVSAELLKEGFGEQKDQHGLAHDGGPRHGTEV